MLYFYSAMSQSSVYKAIDIVDGKLLLENGNLAVLYELSVLTKEHSIVHGGIVKKIDVIIDDKIYTEDGKCYNHNAIKVNNQEFDCYENAYKNAIKNIKSDEFLNKIYSQMNEDDQYLFVNRVADFIVEGYNIKSDVVEILYRNLHDAVRGVLRYYGVDKDKFHTSMEKLKQTNDTILIGNY